MPDEQFAEKRGRALLAQALKQCEIPERSGDEYPRRFGGGNIYSETTDNDIGVVFSYFHPGAGSLHCSISLRHIATRAAEGFAHDQEVIDALVDVLKSLESSVSVLLPITHHNLLRRAFNLNVRPRADKEIQKAWIALLEQLTPAFSDRRSEMERKLAAERDWRGGSKARLKEDQRRSLHTQYDALHKIARAVKKDYNVTLKRFAKRRAAGGYSHREWQTNWRKYVAENYPPETTKDFLGLFARKDNPSASEVAYFKLSKLTPHKKSYLPQLVADSRKAAKTVHNEKR